MVHTPHSTHQKEKKPTKENRDRLRVWRLRLTKENRDRLRVLRLRLAGVKDHLGTAIFLHPDDITSKLTGC